MVLVKEPVPEPLVVLLFDTVGFCVVLQQTPRAVTEAPPSDVTDPPEVAPDWVMELADRVVTVGTLIP